MSENYFIVLCCGRVVGRVWVFTRRGEGGGRRVARETLRPTGVSKVGALRAAGASRTYRRAYPAANGLSRIFEGIGIALWRYVYPLDSMPGSPVSSGAATGAIRFPPNVSGSILRSPRRHHPRRCLP